jgi:hypothetical protein
MSEMIERIGKALAPVECFYSMKMISLVDGISTYEVTYDDGEKQQYVGIDAAYEDIKRRKGIALGRAALEAIKFYTPKMGKAALDVWDANGGDDAGVLGPFELAAIWQAMIDAALSEDRP